MTRFARKGGVAENKEAKKKKLDATEWTVMFNNKNKDAEATTVSDNESGTDETDQIEELNRKKRKHEHDLNKRIERENANTLPKPSDYDFTMNKYASLIDKEVLDDLLEMKQQKKIDEADFLERVVKEARSNQRRLSRQNERETSKICFKCRRPGHAIDDCPEMRRDSEQGTGICYKCGSTEHAISKCKVKVEPGSFYFTLNVNGWY